MKQRIRPNIFRFPTVIAGCCLSLAGADLAPWGGFAEFASAERGLRVTGITISRAQHDYARERIRLSGLDDRVEISLQDYRDARGRYDGVASIEMFEAVGERYWPVYCETRLDGTSPAASTYPPTSASCRCRPDRRS